MGNRKRMSVVGRMVPVSLLASIAAAIGGAGDWNCRSIRADGVYAWGNNYFGQLGNGTYSNISTVPLAVTSLSSSVTVVSVGLNHSLAIQNGAAYAWGNNESGQLGIGMTSPSYPYGIPTAVPVTGLNTGVTSVSGGAGYTLAIQNGGAYAWGKNDVGQLGISSMADSDVPVAVTGLNSGVTAVAGGGDHSLAIQNGGVWAWGKNDAGQLGNNSTADSDVPVSVTGLSSGVSAIACGDKHNLTIQNGVAYAWGWNPYGQLGNGSTTNSNVPVAVTGLGSHVSAIAAGNSHSLAIQNGVAYAWGWSGYGELGTGLPDNSAHPTPVAVPGLPSDMVEVAAGSYTSYALSAEGNLWAWGLNTDGQLGVGTSTGFYSTPQQVTAPAGYVYTSIAAGVGSAFALATVAPRIQTIQTTIPPASVLTTTNKPTSSQLMVYTPSGGGAFQSGSINPALPTVVLTLGFNEHVTNWPTMLARALPFGTGSNFNLVAWDWSADANLGSLPLADSRTKAEGAALGQALSSTLGPAYKQPVHFLGHSLGTLVNSQAITVLHSNNANIQIQDTLFDEASIANNLPGIAPSSEVDAIPTDSRGNAIPTRIDNYISAFGSIYSQAANFILQQNPYTAYSPSDFRYWLDFHNYPMVWYQGTIPAQPTGLGYSGAIEGPYFGSTASLFQPGTYAAQNPAAGMDYVFSSKGATDAASILLARNTQLLATLASYQNTYNSLSVLGSVESPNIWYSGVTTADLTGAVQVQNNVLVNIQVKQALGQAVLVPQVILAKVPSNTLPAGVISRAIAPASATPTSSSYAWLPITIPSGAQFLSLDFTFHSLSPGDFLAIGVNDAPIFQLEDQFVVEDTALNTGLLDVSPWAGQNINLFFGLVASDDNNAGGTIMIDNISFATVPEPSSLALLAGAAGLMIARRPRRRQ